MRITPISLTEQSTLINDYRQQRENIMEHFTYDPYLQGTYRSRANSLQQKSIDRSRLADALITMNQRWDAPEATFRNIERLKGDDSVVAIGGQQAGLLTGPMYTVNKIISIIQFARKQEEELGKPVIPVFWIAGEDHDFAEIDHIYLPEDKGLSKYRLAQQVTENTSVSDIAIDKSAANDWVDQLFEQLRETSYTQNLYQSIENCLQQSVTYVDFFARVLYQLFTDEGLVLVNSADPGLRKIEQDHFLELIEKQSAIATGVNKALNILNQKGYAVSLETNPDDAHLFYHDGLDRRLLLRDEEGNWIGKQGDVLLTTDEMRATASYHPEQLSNNVVTRPLMQEWLFPTLAFIGGPGEVGYWSALKPAFDAVDMEMPPVLPRLSLTFVDRRVEKVIQKHNLNAASAVNQGTESFKIQWLAARSNPPLQQLTASVKEAVDQAHKPIRDIARDTRTDIGELADKNLYYLNEHIDYLESRINRAIEDQYAQQLNEFDVVQQVVRPHNGLQERIWNPLWWLNEYGPCFINDLAKETCSFNADHHLVYL
ncbi:bacillithiol biosynthesis cysteine-adding enzyme BshC [Barrientosiimonas marina]|uniref:Putative cysteine ligase BshC n=1 Tax=Lentibacillus kimchii TaxID=1542911 RepID=A0ABW2UR46_9BACI